VIAPVHEATAEGRQGRFHLAYGRHQNSRSNAAVSRKADSHGQHEKQPPEIWERPINIPASTIAAICRSLRREIEARESPDPDSFAAARVVEPPPCTALGESFGTPPNGPAFAWGRTLGTCKEVCCFDRHIRTVLGAQFFHDLANMNFHRASRIFSSCAMILFDLPCWIARTTASSRLVMAPNAAGCDEGGSRDGEEEASRRDVRPAGQNQANRFDRDFKTSWSLGYNPLPRG
jgi:hypothetical protein